jgi:hypothetical protein
MFCFAWICRSSAPVMNPFSGLQELASEGMLGGLTGSFFSFIGYNMFPAKGPGPSSFALARSHY